MFNLVFSLGSKWPFFTLVYSVSIGMTLKVKQSFQYRPPKLKCTDIFLLLAFLGIYEAG